MWLDDGWHCIFAIVALLFLSNGLLYSYLGIMIVLSTPEPLYLQIR